MRMSCIHDIRLGSSVPTSPRLTKMKSAFWAKRHCASSRDERTPTTMRDGDFMPITTPQDPDLFKGYSAATGWLVAAGGGLMSLYFGSLMRSLCNLLVSAWIAASGALALAPVWTGLAAVAVPV